MKYDLAFAVTTAAAIGAFAPIVVFAALISTKKGRGV